MSDYRKAKEDAADATGVTESTIRRWVEGQRNDCFRVPKYARCLCVAGLT